MTWKPRRALIPAGALLWGLQFAFLNPALALLLVTVYDATASEVGWALAIYNAGGFVASLLVPAIADRAHDYLRPMLVCGVLTLALAAALTASSSLPVAIVALVLLGGPASVGMSLLFAHLKHTGAAPGDIVRTRALVSFAWVAGPPLATVIIAAFGSRAILAAIAVVAVLTIGTTATMRGARTPEVDVGPQPKAGLSGRVVAVVVVFIALQATNSATVSIMSLFVTDRLGLDVAWAGAVLGLAAGLEIPALLLIGQLSDRVPGTRLLLSGCVAGVVYYAAMAFATGPVILLGLQVLNAWFFAAVAGVGLTLFQELIPRPGLAAGLYANTRRLGAVASGPLIAIGSATALGYGGVFLACAAITVAALAGLRMVPAEHPEEVGVSGPSGEATSRS